MNTRIIASAAALAAGTLVLASCGGSGGDADGSGDATTLSVAGWSVATTPEFQLLADGFEAQNEGVTVNIVDYDPSEYNTLLTADLAAGSGPDIITQKEVKFVTTFQEGGQLADVSDVSLPAGIGGAESYVVDGVTYATPYRQDAWVLFYNADLFDEAGVDTPDGTWTWDDYEEAARQIADNTDVNGTYQHSWQSVLQGFANAQSPGADLLSGEYGYFAPFYERVLRMQDDGLQESYNTVTANQLTYQGEFGRQRAAMLPMGTWFVATLISQQAAGEADDFTWGIAPIPQFDASTTGMDNTPVTFGDPTGFAVNAALEGEKAELAKKFLAYAASEEAAVALAEIGIMPAALSDAVVDAYFGSEGAPTDELSAFAVQTHDTKPENPTSNRTTAIQNILNDMHSAILSGSTDVDSAIAEAEQRVANEVAAD
ncbi:extracellular solute-binding protein [Microbacterium amylolyticum]|uniref:Multiple sugar transport system substrate-binding protein n=1 Tax=Microbacterium amylolyticum TaxID=936337 RepID=A0ABS4ZGH4_9MICO|nr:extracellular solute-binding protein [Microbacterium amylolyticum]MBP2436371.1 multiple sugar transport system substrate-binding protein [Microbacterium amylolyticum]